MHHSDRSSDALGVDHRVSIMGIVNVTPDSFSDGVPKNYVEHAIAHAIRLENQGADILDVGGESTRPGAMPVSEEEECARVLPVIEALASRVRIPISIDTSKAYVMRAAIKAGASIINDVNALRSPGALEAAAQLQVPVVLMHMEGEPRTMQNTPKYTHVVEDVFDFLQNRICAARNAGIPKKHILIDPGFGFGKTPTHNFELLAGLNYFAKLGVPILVGLSRKSCLGVLCEREVPRDRIFASVAAHLIAVQKGARIVRVHDVGATRDALKVWNAVQSITQASATDTPKNLQVIPLPGVAE